MCHVLYSIVYFLLVCLLLVAAVMVDFSTHDGVLSTSRIPVRGAEYELSLEDWSSSV